MGELMQHNLSRLRNLYRACLYLLPAPFREEYGEEMAWVFSQAAADAAAKGQRALAAVAARELAGLAREGLTQRWRASRQHLFGYAAARAPGWDGPPPRREALLALAVFIVPALALLYQGSLALAGRATGYLAAGLLLGALLAGAARGFPRWSLPYLGMALSALSFFFLFGWEADLLAPHAAYRFGLVARDSSSRLLLRSAWAGLMWLELFAVTAAALGLLALVRRFRPLLQRIRQDWTLVSYMLYSGMVVLLTLSFAQHQSERLLGAGSVLCLAAGSFLYLYSPRPWQRTVALLGGLTLAIVAAAAGQWPVEPVRVWPVWENWPRLDGERWVEARGLVLAWAWMSALLLAPGLMKRLVKNRRPQAG